MEGIKNRAYENENGTVGLNNNQFNEDKFRSTSNLSILLIFHKDQITVDDDHLEERKSRTKLSIEEVR